MKKIIVRTGGGLGNQLFMYAAARKLAIKLNRTLVIDYILEKKPLYKRSYQLNNFNINGKKAEAILCE